MGKKRGEINPICGERLKIVAKEQKMSQIEFAKVLFITPEHLSAIIHGRKSLTEATAKLVVENYPEYRIEWLLGYSDSKTVRDLWDEKCKKTDAKNKAKFEHGELFAEYIDFLGFDLCHNKVIDENDILLFSEHEENPLENMSLIITEQETEEEKFVINLDFEQAARRELWEKMKDFSALRITDKETDKKVVISQEKMQEFIKEIDDFILFKMQRLFNEEK